VLKPARQYFVNWRGRIQTLAKDEKSKDTTKKDAKLKIAEQRTLLMKKGTRTDYRVPSLIVNRTEPAVGVVHAQLSNYMRTHTL
jgi:hypothetical protein